MILAPIIDTLIIIFIIIFGIIATVASVIIILVIKIYTNREGKNAESRIKNNTAVIQDFRE